MCEELRHLKHCRSIEGPVSIKQRYVSAVDYSLTCRIITAAAGLPQEIVVLQTNHHNGSSKAYSFETKIVC